MGSPPRSMVYLYGLLILSLASLLWAVWAITKHVRKQAAEEAGGGDTEDSHVASRGFGPPGSGNIAPDAAPLSGNADTIANDKDELKGKAP